MGALCVLAAGTLAAPEETAVKTYEVDDDVLVEIDALRAKYGRALIVREAERHIGSVVSAIRQNIVGEARRLNMACAPLQQRVSDYETGIRGFNLSKDERSMKIIDLIEQLAGAQMAINWLLAAEVDAVLLDVRCSSWYCDRASMGVRVGGHVVCRVEASLAWTPGFVTLVLGSALILLTLLIGA